MHRVVTKLAATLIGVSACLSWLSAQQPGPAVLLDGARLITGNPEAPIERSAFLVENGRFTRVGAPARFRCQPAGRAST